ncbi:uncharacterized protein B0J16DRAFT_168932 [Fusarium flagelliforme]|uniref:uncharacterized protein n=1 Tax=Fusarium flagelliforme TaxID=2675880 RepID=UPI001E8E7D2D|nr:uncharacterized protein B0J16DRAFT_168932 [Fusarium flagelliforme]KAH7179321.1 hypothetical protein B0J16DRAFT_168932 [Fusarium flagelliforme]
MSNITTWSLVTTRGVLLSLTVSSCSNCNSKHVRVLFTAFCLSRIHLRVSNHVFLLQSPHNRTCDRPPRPSNRTVTVKSERFSRSTRDLKQQIPSCRCIIKSQVSSIFTCLSLEYAAIHVLALHDAEHAAIFPTFMTKVHSFKMLVTVRSGQLDSFCKPRHSSCQIDERKARESLASWFHSCRRRDTFEFSPDSYTCII